MDTWIEHKVMVTAGSERGPIVRSLDRLYDPPGTLYEVREVEVEVTYLNSDPDPMVNVRVRGLKLRKDGRRSERVTYLSQIIGNVETV